MSKAAILEATRASQKEWLNNALTATGLSPSALAAKAGLSDTTVSRFLNSPSYKRALSATTMSALRIVVRRYERRP